MKRNNSSARSGFTLLELLVSAGVLSLVSVIIAQVVFTTVRLAARTELMKEMKQTGGMTMETMKRMIQNARSITSVCNGTPRSELTIVNFDGGETTFSCEQDTTYEDYDIYRVASYSSTLATTTHLSSGNVTLVTSEGVAGCGYVNSAGAALSFTCVDAGSTGPSVTIMFQLRQKNTNTGLFEGDLETFQSTAILRNE